MKLTISLSKKLFREYLTDLGYKKRTKETKMAMLKVFMSYITTHFEHNDLRNITADNIREFLKYIEKIKGERTGAPYSKRFKLMIFRVVQQFFKALYVKEKILIDPSTSIHYVSSGETHEKVIFTVDEITTFLDSIECKTYIQRRDRALFELMYSSGLRVGEIVNIRKSDINFIDSTVFIRLGKFSKDRVVPVCDTALYFLDKFSRRKRKDSYLFISSNATNKLSPSAINKRLHKYLQLIGIDKEGVTCHSIRHSTASHLLDRGADIRYVQTLLGHESIETTVVYTHLLTDSLKKIYKSYHPRENQTYTETDSDYLNALEELEKSIIKQKENKKRRP
jgi:integrase/recombinase XerD